MDLKMFLEQANYNVFAERRRATTSNHGDHAESQCQRQKQKPSLLPSYMLFQLTIPALNICILLKSLNFIALVNLSELS